MAPKTQDPSLTRFYFSEATVVSDLRDRRLIHPHEDHERDAALVVQLCHEAEFSTQHRELSGAEWRMATTAALPPEWVPFWHLPAVSVVYTTASVGGQTYYLVDRVFYDGAAVKAVVALNTITALT